jgi:hypothetical protein
MCWVTPTSGVKTATMAIVCLSTQLWQRAVCAVGPEQPLAAVVCAVGLSPTASW